jgi:flagellar M-ring protein FliF
MWQQPETVEMVRTLAVPLVLGLLGLALVFGVIRPVLGDLRADRLAQQPPATRQLDAVVDDLTELPALQGRSTLPTLAGPATVSDADKRLEAVRQMARTNPASVARILRGWSQGQDAG